MEWNIPQQVVIKDIEMRFGSMVVFILKWTLASIPAVFLLLLIVYFIALLMYPFFTGLIGNP